MTHAFFQIVTRVRNFSITNTNDPFMCINFSLYGSTVILLDLGRFFSFLILYTVGRTPWTEGQPRRKAATYTQNNTNTE
jgi:hypothetical protein